MTQIFVNCPRNGEPVSTGLKAEWVLLDSLPVTVPLRCPSCGGTHHWKPDEAWIGAARYANSADRARPPQSGDRDVAAGRMNPWDRGN